MTVEGGFTELIKRSIYRTRLMLFTPFNVRKWLIFLVIAMLSGAMSGGGSGNFDGLGSKEGQETTDTQDTKTSGDPVLAPDAEGDTQEAFEDESPFVRQKGSSTGSSYTFLIPLAILLGLAVLIALLWLGAHFRFVWFNAVVKDDTAIKEPFKKYQPQANSLFRVFLAIAGGSVLIMFLIGSQIFNESKKFGGFQEILPLSPSAAVQMFGSPLVLGAMVIMVLAFLFLIIDDFIVVMMAKRQVGFRDSQKIFFGLYQEHSRDFWRYILVKLGLGILTGLMESLIVFVFLLVCVIAGAVVFGIPYLLFVSLLKIPFLFWTLAVIAGIPFGALAITIFFGIGLPFAVFHRNFSLYFISSLGPAYEILPLEEPRD
jgi:hypothetical protein